MNRKLIIVVPAEVRFSDPFGVRIMRGTPLPSVTRWAPMAA
jgi:hypothetical protein